MSSLRFRAWCTKSLQWLNPEEHYLGMDGRGIVYNYEDIGCGVLGVDIGQKSVVVEQFTGLKDKNGINIFEGDVLRIAPDNYIGHVEWVDGAGFYTLRNREIGPAIRWDLHLIDEFREGVYTSGGGRATTGVPSSSRMEVIGNIHQHWHLLVQAREELERLLAKPRVEPVAVPARGLWSRLKGLF